MAKWEYRVCAIRNDGPAQVEEQVNVQLKSLGDDGWRFVETIYAQNQLPLLLFKKQGKLNVKFGSDKSTGS